MLRTCDVHVPTTDPKGGRFVEVSSLNLDANRLTEAFLGLFLMKFQCRRSLVTISELLTESRLAVSEVYFSML